MDINATLIAQAIVFTAFVAICWKFIYPPMLSMMHEREQRIAEGLEAAKKADDSLEEAKLMYDKELSKAKKEAAEIIEKANSRASQIVIDAKTKAEEEAEKIMTSANTTIESETNRAKEDLRQQMSDIIIDTTKKILDEEISAEKHDDLLKKSSAGPLMIELTPLARPYAKAVFASALDAASVDETKEELKIMALVSTTTEVQNLIEDPTLSKDEVLKSLSDLLDGSISKISQSLLNVLAENNRLNLLEAIFGIYQEIVAKHKEQKSVEVFVATKPSDDTTETIKTRLVSTYGEGTNIEFKIDPNIMGGLSIKVGDETLDLSIRGKVKKLINQLNF